jgi:hypothetical protein
MHTAADRKENRVVEPNHRAVPGRVGRFSWSEPSPMGDSIAPGRYIFFADYVAARAGVKPGLSRYGLTAALAAMPGAAIVPSLCLPLLDRDGQWVTPSPDATGHPPQTVENLYTPAARPCK